MVAAALPWQQKHNREKVGHGKGSKASMDTHLHSAGFARMMEMKGAVPLLTWPSTLHAHDAHAGLVFVRWGGDS